MTTTSTTTATTSGTTISLPGLATGLDTTTLISQLMTIASQQKTALQSTVTTKQTVLSDYQSLNSQLAALTTSAGTASTGGSLAMTGTSTDSSISVTASTGATDANLQLQVTALAAKHTVISGAMSTWPDSSGAITIVGADGTTHSLTASSTNLDDVVSAINKSGLGISATKIAAGTDSTGATVYRLELTASKTGAANAFTAYAGDSSAVSAGTATELDTMSGGSIVTQGSDASVTLWPGTASAQTVTSSSNTFSNILSDVSISVSAVTSSAATLEVSTDTSTTSSNVSSFVSSIQTILSYIDTNATATTSSSSSSSSTDSTSTSTTTFGAFGADTTISRLRDAIVAAVQQPVNGVSLSTIGITVDKSGDVSFDSDTFASAMASDPQGTMALYQAVTARVQTTASAASDSNTGTLTKSISSQQSAITSLDDQIDDWTTRLAAKQATLEQQYTALEVSISKLNSISSYLTAQVNALTGTSSSSSKS